MCGEVMSERGGRLGSLTALHVERNKLGRLPYGMHRLTALTSLCLADNLLYDPPQAAPTPLLPPHRA